MADKRIDQLTAATSLGDSDLLVVEQESAAKKATGTVVSNYINSKFGLSGMASDISTLQTAVAGKQDALTLPLPISQGGTNATTVGNARINLGLGPAAVADIDPTLSIQGAAADAKAAGDWIFPLYFDSNDAGLWVQGAINSSTGNNTSSTTRLRTNDYIGKGVKMLSVASGYRYMLFAYDDGEYVGTWNGSAFVQSGNWLTSETDLTKLPNYDFRLVFSYGSATVYPDDALNLTMTSVTDSTLTVAGAAADAEATGVLRDVLYEKNAVDILAWSTARSGSNNGVTYTYNADGSCSVSGTASGLSFSNILSSVSALPQYVKAGRRYYLDTHGASGKVRLRVSFYKNGASAGFVIYHENKEITFPEDITGLTVRYDVQEGVSVDETVHYTLTAVPEGAASLEVAEQVDTLTEANQTAQSEMLISRNYGFWDQGTLNVSTGERNESTAGAASGTRIRTGVFVGYENGQIGVEALNGYSFTVWKYETDNTYIGVLHEDGEFTKAVGAELRTAYDFDPGYIYKIVLFAPDTTATIHPPAGAENVRFTTYRWLEKYPGVRIAFIGDSIIAGRLGDVAAGVGTRPRYTIPQRVEQELGVFTFNYAVGGMGWIGDTSGASRGNAYGLVKTLDLSSYTHVVLSLGANDGAFSLGTIEDTEATESTSTSSGGTIIGNIYGVLDYIHTTWPELQVILISPFMNKHGSFPTWGWAASTTAGWTWAQLSSKMDEVAERYHLQLIHGDRAINSWLVGDYIGSETDSVHPVEQGYNLIGRYVAGQLATFL